MRGELGAGGDGMVFDFGKGRCNRYIWHCWRRMWVSESPRMDSELAY